MTGFFETSMVSKRGPDAAVREVDQHAEGVHPLHDGHAEIAEADVLSLGGAGAQVVQLVVGELDLADAEVVEEVDVVDDAVEMGAVLEAEQDAELAFALGLEDVGAPADVNQLVGMAGEVPLPFREVLDRGIVGERRSTRPVRVSSPSR